MAWTDETLDRGTNGPASQGPRAAYDVSRE